jgi:hypothetical protein
LLYSRGFFGEVLNAGAKIWCAGGHEELSLRKYSGHFTSMDENASS